MKTPKKLITLFSAIVLLAGVITPRIGVHAAAPADTSDYCCLKVNAPEGLKVSSYSAVDNANKVEITYGEAENVSNVVGKVTFSSETGGLYSTDVEADGTIKVYAKHRSNVKVEPSSDTGYSGEIGNENQYSPGWSFINVNNDVTYNINIRFTNDDTTHCKLELKGATNASVNDGRVMVTYDKGIVGAKDNSAKIRIIDGKYYLYTKAASVEFGTRPVENYVAYVESQIGNTNNNKAAVSNNVVTLSQLAIGQAGYVQFSFEEKQTSGGNQGEASDVKPTGNTVEEVLPMTLEEADTTAKAPVTGDNALILAFAVLALLSLSATTYIFAKRR